MTAPASKKARTKKAAAPVNEAAFTDEEMRELARLEPSEDGPIAEDGSIRPVQIGKRGRTPNELTTIFHLDGVDYAIPAKPSPMLVLKWMRACRVPKGTPRARAKDIISAATQDVLLDLLGQEAMDALATSPEVTEEDVADIIAIVATIFFGARNSLIEKAANPS